jgi:hypothetical protein
VVYEYESELRAGCCVLLRAAAGQANQAAEWIDRQWTDRCGMKKRDCLDREYIRKSFWREEERGVGGRY